MISSFKYFERSIAVSIVLALLTIFFAMALIMPTPTPPQFVVFRIIIALLAAMFGALLPGLVNFAHPTARVIGALALFVIVYFFIPTSLTIDTSYGNSPEIRPSYMLTFALLGLIFVGGLLILIRPVMYWSVERKGENARLKIDGEEIHISGLTSEEIQKLLDIFKESKDAEQKDSEKN